MRCAELVEVTGNSNQPRNNKHSVNNYIINPDRFSLIEKWYSLHLTTNIFDHEAIPRPYKIRS